VTLLCLIVLACASNRDVAFCKDRCAVAGGKYEGAMMLNTGALRCACTFDAEEP
jgi:hypothetical protein